MDLVIIDDFKFINKILRNHKATQVHVLSFDGKVCDALQRRDFKCLSSRDVLDPHEVDKLRAKDLKWQLSLGRTSMDDSTLEDLTRENGYSLWDMAMGSLIRNSYLKVKLDAIFGFLPYIDRALADIGPVRRVFCYSRNFLLRQLVLMRLRNGEALLYPRMHFDASRTVLDVIRLFALEGLKTCKEMARLVVGRIIWRDFLNQTHYDILLTSYITAARFGNSTSIKSMGFDELRAEFERRGKSVLFVGHDYSKKSDLCLFDKSHRIVPFEVSLSPIDFLFAWKKRFKMVRIWKKVCDLINKHGLFIRYNTDLWPLLRPHFFYLFLWFIPDAIRYLRAFCRLIRRYHFSDVCLCGEYSRIGLCTVISTKSNNAKTHAFQHGIIHKYHPGYFNLGIEEEECRPLPDSFFVFGENEKSLLKDNFPLLARRCRVIGSLNFDLVYRINSPEQRSRIILKYGLPLGKKKIVFFASGQSDDYLKEIMEELGQFQERYDVEIMIKIHPREPFVGRFRKLARNTYGKLKIGLDWDTYELLAIAEIVVVGFSTLAQEAVAIGKNVVIINWRPTLYRLQFDFERLALEVKDRTKFRSTMEAILADPPRIPLDELNRFAQRYFNLIDGNVAKRAVNAILYDGTHIKKVREQGEKNNK